MSMTDELKIPDGAKSLPRGWAWVTLGTIVFLRSQKVAPSAEPALPFVGMEDIENDGLTICGTRPFSTMKSVGNRFYRDDILYGRLRPYLNKTAVASHDGVASGELLVFQTQKLTLDRRFLQYFLHSKWFVNAAMATTSGDRPRADFADLAKFTIPLPPLAEQKRIVARIDELFAEIAEGEAALARARSGLETFRRALLKSAVTGELTREWREKHRPGEAGEGLRMRIVAGRSASSSRRGRGRKALSVSPSEIAPTFEAPDGWAWSSLGELFQISTGSTPSRTDPSLWGGGVPWVSSGEVAFCRIRSTRETITTSGLGNASTRLNPPGTVLLAMIGEGKTRGQCAILDVAAANNQNAASIRVSETPIPPEYVYHVLEERYFASRRESQGGSQPALNAGIIGQMPIALPPLAEIEEILRRVSEALAAHADTLALLDAEASDAARLRQAVLKAAFEGRLVPQDSNDEPAGVMLERIATENPLSPRNHRGRPRKR